MNKHIAHIGFIVILIASISCQRNYTPKPRGYFRIDLPEKKYETALLEGCPFSFEKPVYGNINPVKESFAEPCWYNLTFPTHGATVYLTYSKISNDLNKRIEDIRSIAYKHSIKADDIEEKLILNQEKKLFGVLYDIKGNTASSVNFFITDSTNHFLSGSLYFNTTPNVDSLAPAIKFFRDDIIHLMETTKWE